MRPWPLLAIAALAACVSSRSLVPPPPTTAPARLDTSTGPDAAAAGPTAWARALDIVADAKVRSSWAVDDESTDALSRAGLTEALALSAIDELSARCESAGGWSACGLTDDEERARDVVLRWLGRTASDTAIPMLLSLDSRSIFAAGQALEDVLVARASAAVPSCAPPTAEAVASMAATLGDFAVLERVDGRLVARRPTDAERDDLAYFLVAVADAGPEVGEEPRTHGSGVTPDATDVKWRVATLERLAEARDAGDVAAMYDYGTRYLQSLGYPGSIDVDGEADHAWGGARFSYVMRDVALAAEILGEPGVAADLYRRAEPGGGACGTSVDYRRGEQVAGLVRAADLAGRCGATIPERLMDWDGQAGSFYGPDRLADAGYDVARLYRGAFVTRHRDAAPEEIAAAIDRAPSELRQAARERLAARGAEAWEARVWAVEGFADELGPRGVELLLAELPRTSGSVRARTIAAIGQAARRTFMGPCPEDVLWLEGIGSNVWSRPVAMYGTDCTTRPTDADADAMHTRIAPALRESGEVRIAAIEALAAIAAPTSVPVLTRMHRRSSAALARCRTRPEAECEAEQALHDATDSAMRRLEDIRGRD